MLDSQQALGDAGFESAEIGISSAREMAGSERMGERVRQRAGGGSRRMVRMADEEEEEQQQQQQQQRMPMPRGANAV